MTRKGLNQIAQSSSPKWAKVASAVAVALAVPATQAVGISWGDWEGSFDSTISIGSSWRIEEQSANLIARGQPFDNGGIGNRFSYNGDDGNLNFHKGDAFSQVIKGVHDFGLQHSSGVGFFVRGLWAYDHKYENGDFRYYGQQENPFYENDPRVEGFSDEALDIHGTDTRLLDAYIYNTWYFDDSVLQVRLGEQVVNWGESTFIQHSISEANPIDITRLRVPGSELKEAFIPVQTLWASWDLSENVTLEGYMQFEWESIRLDEAGTYFSTSDFAGDSGEYIWLGFTLNPSFEDRLEATLINAARRVDDPDRAQASDDGQFGIRLGWYAPELGGAEFGFYYINYHNKRPVISANKFDVANDGIIGTLEYIEDIELYGVSFNTATDGGLSISGEISYRQDEPLQVDDVELLFAALEGVTATVPLGTSQLNGAVAPGEYIAGYRLFDTIQGQVTMANLFGPGLGAEQWTGLVEIGFNQIQDFPGVDELRFEAPGTYRSGNPDRAGFEGVEENSFAEEFSWGYRAVLKADYKGFIGSWNMAPRIVFQHDVSGITPAPISNFVEGRKALAFGLEFDYLKRYKVNFGYNRYFGGGTQNLLSDRDFVSLNASYSF
ncbi:DUF1302 domain-containing protein [Pleionea sediminis]|uniref:DUF1302 domain-containing protein n=1 Tax=Pleionea sediminis TaxID=2569479 RepID=UPI0011863B85|nr:DUF1302 domain-containing protein [Pleionea sediminis]